MDRAELLKILSQNSHAKRFKANETIVKQGEPGTLGLAFLLQGEAKVQQEQGETSVTIGSIKAGQFFGETALVLSRPRGASVVAQSDDAIVMFINPMGFMKYGLKNPTLLDMLISHTISRIENVINSLVKHFPIPELMIDPSLIPIIEENRKGTLHLQDMLNHTRTAWIGVDKPVFEQGDRNDGSTFLLVKGKVKVVRKNEDQESTLFYFSPGDFFGYSHRETTPNRKFSAVACDDSARIISFDNDLLDKILKINPEVFFYVYRSMVTQLVILDDALRLASSRRNMAPNDPRTQSIIEAGFKESPKVPIEEAIPEPEPEPEPNPEETVLFEVDHKKAKADQDHRSIEETDEILEQQLKDRKSEQN